MTLLANLKDAYQAIHFRDLDDNSRTHLDRFVHFAAASMSPAEHDAQENLAAPSPTAEQIAAIRAELLAEVEVEVRRKVTAELEASIGGKTDAPANAGHAGDADQAAETGDQAQAKDQPAADAHASEAAPKVPVPLPVPGAQTAPAAAASAL